MPTVQAPETPKSQSLNPFSMFDLPRLHTPLRSLLKIGGGDADSVHAAPDAREQEHLIQQAFAKSKPDSANRALFAVSRYSTDTDQHQQKLFAPVSQPENSTDIWMPTKTAPPVTSGAAGQVAHSNLSRRSSEVPKPWSHETSRAATGGGSKGMSRAHTAGDAPPSWHQSMSSQQQAIQASGSLPHARAAAVAESAPARPPSPPAVQATARSDRERLDPVKALAKRATKYAHSAFVVSSAEVICLCQDMDPARTRPARASVFQQNTARGAKSSATSGVSDVDDVNQVEE